MDTLSLTKCQSEEHFCSMLKKTTYFLEGRLNQFRLSEVFETVLPKSAVQCFVPGNKKNKINSIIGKSAHFLLRSASEHLMHDARCLRMKLRFAMLTRSSQSEEG